MIIVKEYDIEKGRDLLNESIIEALQKGSSVVRVNMVQAYQLYDLLDALCNGTKLDEQKEADSLPKCYGKYYQNSRQCNNITECKYRKSCVVEAKKKEKKKVPDCYGKYTVEESWERQCEECPEETRCRNSSFKEKNK